MRYVSTRGGPPVDLATALRHGPAPDGGLYLPEAVPALPSRTPAAPGASAFASTAARVLLPYAGDALAAEDLGASAREAFPFDVPLVRVDEDTWALELTHGPTGAFKDVGARFLAAALARLAPATPDEPRTVLVATSGDTGAAVAHAFRDLPHTRVVVLFPEGRVSDLQRRQLTTLGGSVDAIAVRGPFDACQRLVRGALADDGLRSRHGLTSANSLNLGRLLPQIAFYVHAAGRLVAVGEARPPTFVVPSGNLGNLTAGVLAARMGLGVAGFVAALNANDALLSVLEGEAPAGARATIPTLSSAMDVGLPSNAERLRALAGARPPATALGIVGMSVTDRETREAMGRLWRKHGYLADPHTAVGFEALRRLRREGGRVPGAAGRAALRELRAHGGVAGPAVVLATAHPAKFPHVVREATGFEPPAPAFLAALADRPERLETIDADPSALAGHLARVRERPSPARR